MKLRYLLRETRINLWRNVSLTVATVFAVAVSLALFGSALMVSDGIGEATKQWEGDIEFQVWMNPDATPEQNTAITEALQTSPQIRSFEFINQQQAFVEFQELFADTPELLEAVVAEDLPPSYRVVPENPDANSVAELGAQFRERPGVKDVVFASEIIKDIQSGFGLLSTGLFIASVVLLIVVLLLILNTIIMAINGRRREIEVMKLVGASNWYVRLPFIFEGLVHGIVGAALSIVGIWSVRKWGFESLRDFNGLKLFAGFRVTAADFRTTSIILIVVGISVAVIGSTVAVSRHLDV